MLDLHWNTIAPCGPAKPQAMADYPNAVSFWQQVATRYKNNPLVGFDLYNEPHNISESVWRFGGTVTWKGTTYNAAGMQQMYDAGAGSYFDIASVQAYGLRNGPDDRRLRPA